MKEYKFSEVEPYFKKRLDNLRKILNSGYRLESAILALCYIDALGNLFMKVNRTKKKFLELIFSYGRVNNFRWDKVNLAESKKIMAVDKLNPRICISCYEIVEQYANQNTRQYDYCCSRQCIEKDKDLTEVINEISGLSKNKICECSEALLKYLNDSTYGGILYNKYRCEGVHRGKFDELWDSLSGHFDEPFYMSVEDSSPDFSIPPEFIIQTFAECLVNLKENFSHPLELTNA